MHFFYHFDHGISSFAGPDTSPMVFDIRVYALADKYFVPPLQTFARSNFEKRLAREWATPTLAGSIDEIYGFEAPRLEDLRRTVLQTVTEHTELLSQEQTYPHFHTVLNKITEFAADISKALASDSGSHFRANLVCYACPNAQCVSSNFGFAVDKSALVGWLFDCPRGCYGPKPKFWWEKYEVNKSKAQCSVVHLSSRHCEII